MGRIAGSRGRPLVATSAPGPRSAMPALAAVALARAALGRGREPNGTPLVCDLAAREPYRAGVLAAEGARDLARAVAGLDGWRAAPRGRLCFATYEPLYDDPTPDAIAETVASLGSAGLIGGEELAVHAPPPAFRAALEGATASGPRPVALIQAAPGGEVEELPLLGALSIELRRAGVRHRIWRRRPGAIQARRALAGLDPGGETARRAAGTARMLAAEGGQAVPAVLGLIFATVAVALILVAVGGAVTAKGRAQRAVDLAALSAARSMRDDFPRLYVPAVRADGSPDPRHLERAEYEARAAAAAREGARRNGLAPASVRVSFPEGGSVAPTRVEVAARPRVHVGEEISRERTEVGAEAAVSPATAPASEESTATATGGGYSGPLASRQGKPMRPDVAAAFDRMSAAAAADGVALTINSAFRSDAEQAELFAANPDPRMVAPPGTSLHRCGTELDLGPSSAYGWLAANAGRFGFVQRYSWEAWHYGFVRGPEPCSAAGDAVGDAGARPGDGRAGGSAGLPGFVPAQYRRTLLEAAAGNDVPAAVLAAQLMAESNFNPAAVSAAGAEGIAQFIPETAAAYGLEDPFDPEQAIEAQARLMADLLGQFGELELALAAYNAGPAPVAACSCVPAYPETQAYVARILALLDGAGELGTVEPELEVRLVD